MNAYLVIEVTDGEHNTIAWYEYQNAASQRTAKANAQARIAKEVNQAAERRAEGAAPTGKVWQLGREGRTFLGSAGRVA